MAESVQTVPTSDFRLRLATLPAKVGMLAFLLSEVAFFSTLITTYVVFLRETKGSVPSPKEVFHLPLVLAGTACLLSQQRHHSFCRQGLRPRPAVGFLGFGGYDDRARGNISGLHRQGMARADHSRMA